jgi:phytoene synthase
VEPLVDESRRAIQRGSKSFALAARLFDPPTREGAILLYAWCRHCDDQIDEQALGFRTGLSSSASTEDRLAALQRETRRALAGDPVGEPAFAALREVVRRHGIPERHPLDLLRGFAMDVEERRHETLDDCCSYCYHVAGVVGVMMAYVMGVRGEDTLDRAADLGIAFQMTNIARDVVDDAEAGRVYLPGDWLREAGVPRGELTRPEHRRAVHSVAERLLHEADRYYASAEAGLGGRRGGRHPPRVEEGGPSEGRPLDAAPRLASRPGVPVSPSLLERGSASRSEGRRGTRTTPPRRAPASCGG